MTTLIARADRHPRAGPPGRLRPAPHRGRARTRARRCATTSSPRSSPRCFDDALGFIRSALEARSSKARLPARQLRQRQEPLHGGAAPAAPAQRRRALDPRAGAGRRQARRLARGQAVPARALPHDRRAAAWSRPSSGTTSSTSGGCTRTRRLPGVYLAERLFDGRPAHAAAHGRRGVLRAAQRGQGRRRAAAGARSARRWDAARFEAALRAPRRGRRSAARLVGDLVTPLLPGLPATWPQRGDEAFVSLDDGLSHHEPARQGARLRRGRSCSSTS